MSTHSLPAGYHTITPALIVRDGPTAIDFYQRAFGATVNHRMSLPDGKLMHAELAIGDSSFMLGEEMPAGGYLSPLSLGGSSTTLQIYVEDADATFHRAVAVGGEVVFPMADQFWGDRCGRLKDPFGHQWMIATRIEEVSPEEMERRGRVWVQDQAG